RVGVAVFIEQAAQVEDEIREPVDGRGDIFGQEARALGPGGAARSEEALADVPKRVRLGVVDDELDVARALLAADRGRLVDLDSERRHVWRAHVDEDAR